MKKNIISFINDLIFGIFATISIVIAIKQIQQSDSVIFFANKTILIIIAISAIILYFYHTIIIRVIKGIKGMRR